MAELWDREKNYATGARVLHMGWVYEAVRGTRGEEPLNTDAWRNASFDGVLGQVVADRAAESEPEASA